MDTKTDTVPKKKILKPLLIVIGIVLILILLPYVFFGANFVKHCMTAYENIGVTPLQAYSPEVVMPVPESEIYSDEDVRRALEITQKEALHYLDGSDWLYPWRTAWVVKIWYDPAAADDEIEDGQQKIHIKAEMYSCSDRNWWCNCGFDDTASFTLVRSDADPEWRFNGLGRC